MTAALSRALLVTVLTTGISAGAHAQPIAPTFAHIFGDHAVLQRDRPIAVWGEGSAGRRVTVRLGDRQIGARADAKGHWRATLPAMPAGGPYLLTASDAGATTSLADIKVGDVYLCGGQSNMEFPARLSTNAWSGLGGSANADLRFVNIPHDSVPAPRQDLKDKAVWQVVGPDTVGEASAVCYYMARSLQKSQKVPVGFVHASWGGTTIQGWMTASSLGTLPSYADGLAAVSLLATDPAAANAREERRVEAWWDAHDPDAATQRAWRMPAFDDTAWPAIAPNGSWKDAGIAALADFDGVVWLRTDVTLTAAQAQAADRLQLGPIDTYDSTWVNGVRVGGGTIPWVWRDYRVPAGVFRAGRNVIAIRVLSGGTGGGLTGAPGQRGIGTADGQFIPLPPTWRYRTGMRARDLTVAGAPWDVPNSLTTLYNGMIAPLGAYGFKLAAWYQGESNAGAASEYRTLLPLMMKDWRRQFGQPDLPFLVVQLTAFGSPATAPGKSDWAQLREAQADVVAADRRAALAVTIDIGDRSDIHPTQKTLVGERLARAARVVAYGEAIAPGGPQAISVARSGVDLIVRFRNGQGLRTYSSSAAIGFEACSVRACRYVPATVSGDTIVLAGANQPAVDHVRYAWADAPYVNLYGAGDLPAAPFDLPVD